MIDHTSLYRLARGTLLEPWVARLPSQMDDAFNVARHGDIGHWKAVLEQLPRPKTSSYDFRSPVVRVGEPQDCDGATRQRIEELLRRFHPWRKGPYEIHGIYIDTEWRSDFKWDRLCDQVEPLEDRLVLDVGCGNGYHCWRVLGAGARLVVGIDPYLLYIFQFHAVRHFLHLPPVHILPLGIEDIPQNLHAFDTVFSMGVFHHQRSPFDHLMQLRSCLRSGGELVLETLVIDGDSGRVLVPKDRYAKMRNVWFIPTCQTLHSWLERCHFHDVRLIDVTRTTPAEQRSTAWMKFESLQDYLDPGNPLLTLEGLPAPARAIFLAKAP